MVTQPAPVEVFCSYTLEDELWLHKLEKHLSLLKRKGLISFWHSRLIAPGTDWKQVTDDHLEIASVIILLVSADFFASDYCYGVEMRRAMDRHTANEVRVIPILVRPVEWKDAPFASLKVLPTNAQPITTWKDQDAALADIAAGLRSVIEDLSLSTARVSHASLPDNDTTTNDSKINIRGTIIKGERSQKSPLRNESSSYTLQTFPGLSKAFFDRTHTRNLWFFAWVVIILFVVIFSFARFISPPGRSGTSSRSPQQSTGQQLSGNSDKVSCGPLSVMKLRVDNPTFVFSGNPGRYSGGGNLPRDIGAVLLARKTTSPYTIVLGLQNVQHTGNDMVIDYVTLQLFDIPPIPRPLTVWTQSMGTKDTTHIYLTTYTGQDSSHSLHAMPQDENISLAHDEPDQLDIQIHSKVTAFLKFKVAIIYHINETISDTSQTCALPWIFQVIFSDASNWQEYSIQRGSLVKKA